MATVSPPLREGVFPSSPSSGQPTVAIARFMHNADFDLTSVASELKFKEDYNLFFLFSIPGALGFRKVVDWVQYYAEPPHGAWTDAGKRVKKGVMRGQDAGAPAFEMKPRINGMLLYLKVALCDVDTPDACMVLISAHPDH